MQQCKHKVPHNQSVSTCSDRAISSGHAGHYLTLFWCSEGNLREARAWLWLTLEEGKSRSTGAFSSTSPQNVNSETVCRPTGASESFLGFDHVCKGSTPRPEGPALWSKNSVKVNSEKACCTSQCHPALSRSHYHRADLMANILVPHYNIQFRWLWQGMIFPIILSLSSSLL